MNDERCTGCQNYTGCLICGGSSSDDDWCLSCNGTGCERYNSSGHPGVCCHYRGPEELVAPRHGDTSYAKFGSARELEQGMKGPDVIRFTPTCRCTFGEGDVMVRVEGGRVFCGKCGAELEHELRESD